MKRILLFYGFALTACLLYSILWDEAFNVYAIIGLVTAAYAVMTLVCRTANIPIGPGSGLGLYQFFGSLLAFGVILATIVKWEISYSYVSFTIGVLFAIMHEIARHIQRMLRRKRQEQWVA